MCACGSVATKKTSSGWACDRCRGIEFKRAREDKKYMYQGRINR